MIKWLVVGIAS